MRVYELARELGIDSSTLIERLESLGIEVGSASAGLSEDEIERARAQQDGEGGSPVPPALVASGKTGPPRDRPKGKPTGKPKGYVLKGKGSVQLAGPGHPIIRRGERITLAQWSTLPERLKGLFEPAA